MLDILIEGVVNLIGELFGEAAVEVATDAAIGAATGLAVGAAIGVIALATWSIIEVAKHVASYLKRKSREFGLLAKGRALNDIINGTTDPEIKKEVREIRDSHKGLLIPLDENEECCWDELQVIAPRNVSRDNMADFYLIADDGSYKELE